MYREVSPGSFEPFTDAVFIHPNGSETPRAALELWPEVDLNAIGLYHPADPGVPSGHRVVSETVERVGGVVQFVRVTEPIPAEEIRASMPVLTPRQMRLGLLSAGISDAQIEAALADNPEGIIEWKYASEYQRLHPLVVSLAEAFDLTPEDVDDLWVQAASL